MATLQDSAAAATEDKASTQATDDTPVVDEQVDWQAKVEAAEARADKAENDAKTAAGRLRSQADRDAQFQSLENKVDASAEFQRLYAKHQVSGDMEGFEAEVQQGQADREKRAALDRTNSSIGGLVRGIKDSAEGAGLDLNTSEEFGAVKQLYDNADRLFQIGDETSVTQAQNILVDALKMASSVSVDARIATVERKAEESIVAERSRIATEAQEQALEDVGAHNLDTGASSASGGPESLEELNKVDTRKLKGKALDEQLAKVDAARARESG